MSTPVEKKGRKRRKRFDDLFESGLPRSPNAICSNSMVGDLDDVPKQRLLAYVAERCPGSAEVVDALSWIARTHPKHLRTKELCETLEAVTLVGAAINALLAEDRDRGGTRGESMTIYDLACGHGLGGALLAYRFPGVRVVCVDRERRPCWATYREALEKFGVKAPGSDAVTSNLRFEEGDVTTCLRAERGDYLMCLHGCNELSPFVLETARARRTGFAVMPCCLREGMLGVTTSSSGRNWGIVDDVARYALQVGYLAGMHRCAKVAAISHHITNRFLVIVGDWRDDDPTSEGGPHSDGDGAVDKCD